MAGTLKGSWVATLGLASIIGICAANAETREQVVPEVDAFFKLNEDTRLFLKGAATRGEEADLSQGRDQYKSNEVSASLDFTLQPIFRDRLREEDWEHNRYFWMRIGYHYLGKLYDPEKAENRSSVELDTRQPLADNFWLTGRLKWDLRDIAGENSKRYGVRLGVERPFSAGGRTLVPYAHAEVLYDTRYDMWNQQVYQAGVDIAIHSSWRVEPYFKYQEDTRSEPAHLYAIGLILKYYHLPAIADRGNRRRWPGGLLAQWWPLATQNYEDSRSLIRSFLDVFPYATLWTTEFHEMLLIGSVEPIQLDATRIAERFGQPGVSAALKEVGVASPAALLATYITDRAGLERYAQGASATTDDRPRIEYAAWLRQGEIYRVLPRVLALRTDPTIAQGDEPLMAAIATERRRLMDFYQAGLDASAGERERWAENMGKVLNEDGSNPYYR